jgi:hypothetical protein
MQGVHGNSKSQGSISEGIALFRSVDEIQGDGLVGEAKVEAFEYLEIIPSQGRRRKLRRRSNSGRWIKHCEEPGLLDQSPYNEERV